MLGPGKQRASTRQAHCHAEGILMRRRHVDGPGLGRQRLHDEAFAVDRHTDHTRAQRLEQVLWRQIARFLHRNDIAGLEKHASDDVECLLAAVSHDDVVGRSGNAA